MIKFLNDIRNAENPISNNGKIINTIAVLFLGIVLGTYSIDLSHLKTTENVVKISKPNKEKIAFQSHEKRISEKF